MGINSRGVDEAKIQVSNKRSLELQYKELAALRAALHNEKKQFIELKKKFLQQRNSIFENQRNQVVKGTKVPRKRKKKAQHTQSIDEALHQGEPDSNPISSENEINGSLNAIPPIVDTKEESMRKLSRRQRRRARLKGVLPLNLPPKQGQPENEYDIESDSSNVTKDDVNATNNTSGSLNVILSKLEVPEESTQQAARRRFRKKVLLLFTTHHLNEGQPDNNCGTVNDDNGVKEEGINGTNNINGSLNVIPPFVNSNDKDALSSSARIEMRVDKAKLAHKIREYRLRANFAAIREGYRVQYDANDRIRINGVTYAVAEGATKLVPLDLPNSAPLPNREEVVWGHIKYLGRRSGILRATNKTGRVKEQCRYYTRTGNCGNSIQCRFRHDQHRIRACPKYLQGECHNPKCLLNHNCNQCNTPLCRFFLGNGCKKADCKYLHHRPEHYGDPDYEVWTCRPFAVAGSCSRGELCPFVHLPQCPDFEEYGTCPKGNNCHLEHVVTRRHQRLMATKDKQHVRETKVEEDDDDDVEIASDTEHSHLPPDNATKEPIIISSYTVDPEIIIGGKGTTSYNVYVDGSSKSSEQYSSNQFIIHFSSLESDGLEDNIDYIELDHNDDTEQ